MSGIWIKVFPKEAVPGIGDWAQITNMTGDPQRVDYTEDDFEWTSFQWSGGGSITVTEGLLDVLIVGGGAAASSSFAGGSGGVLHGIQQLSGGEQTILVGTTPTGGNNPDGGRSAIGDDSIGGGLVREKGPNGFKDYESGGYGAGAGSTGDAPDADTGGPGFVSSITGTELEYAQGGGKYRSDPDYAALPPGCGSDRQNNSDVFQYRGTDGAVIIRVPRTSDKTGLSVGSFTIDTLRDKRVATAKETAQTRRKNKTEDK